MMTDDALDVLRELVACRNVEKDLSNEFERIPWSPDDIKYGRPKTIQNDLRIRIHARVEREKAAWDRARALLAAQEPRPEPAQQTMAATPTLADKMRALKAAIDDLEGEEIAYPDAIKLSAAGMVAREWLKYNEAHDD